MSGHPTQSTATQGTATQDTATRIGWIGTGVMGLAIAGLKILLSGSSGGGKTSDYLPESPFHEGISHPSQRPL